MTRAEQVLTVIADRPGIDNIAIADLLGIDPNNVSAVTHQLWDKKGLVTRKFNTDKNRYEYWPKTPEVVKGVVAEVPPAKAVEPMAPPVPEVKAETPAKAPEPVVYPVRKQVVVEHGSDLAQMLGRFDEFAKQLGGYLAAQVKTHFIQELLLMPLPVVPTPVSPPMPTLEELQARIAAHDPSPKAPDLKRVTIIGLLPQQAGMLQSEFHDAFKFNFFKDGPAQQLRDRMRESDYVITFTSKIPYHFEEIIKSAGKEPIRNRGGMTELRDRLMKLYVEEGA